MNAKYIHDACHEAMLECPQFRGYDDDAYFDGYGEFGDIPKKGIYKTIMFWREWGHNLWNSGYEQALPENVIEMFDNIDKVMEKAINDYCKTL